MTATPSTRVPAEWADIPFKYFEVTPRGVRHQFQPEDSEAFISTDLSAPNNDSDHRNRTRKGNIDPSRKHQNTHYHAKLRPVNNTIIFDTAPPINENNKGFKLLQSMGWNAGSSIGRATDGGMSDSDVAENSEDRTKRLHLNDAGLIDVVYRRGRGGLGS